MYRPWFLGTLGVIGGCCIVMTRREHLLAVLYDRWPMSREDVTNWFQEAVDSRPWDRMPYSSAHY